MATRQVVNIDEQTGVTGTSDSFVVSPSGEISVVVKLTSGTPATGCRVQLTLDEPEKITTGTATWVNSPMGAHLVTSAEKILRPVTGLRLSVTDGTWSMQVRQA